ncbi:MAG: J domain-containing protein [Parvibaculum sp.]|nr:J domain-containing protein [Parvibaculum sp.]
MRDPYEILGLHPGAGNAEVKAAYRKLAKQLHPDAQNSSAAQHARFQEVTAAYNQLKDEASRRRFEAERRAAAARKREFHAASEPAGPQNDDLFSELFEGIRSAGKRVFRARGDDRSYRLSVTFLDAANGATKRVRLDGGRMVDVAVPPGIESGKQVRLKGQGGEGQGGADAGDALITVEVEPHPLFERRGDDIHLTLPVTLSEAVLGAKVDVPTVSGLVTLAVPAGSNTGTRLRLRGKGLKGPEGAGDQYVTLSLVLPEAADAALKDFAASRAEGLKHNPRKGFSGF